MHFVKFSLVTFLIKSIQGDPQKMRLKGTGDVFSSDPPWIECTITLPFSRSRLNEISISTLKIDYFKCSFFFLMIARRKISEFNCFWWNNYDIFHIFGHIKVWRLPLWTRHARIKCFNASVVIIQNTVGPINIWKSRKTENQFYVYLILTVG